MPPVLTDAEFDGNYLDLVVLLSCTKPLILNVSNTNTAAVSLVDIHLGNKILPECSICGWNDKRDPCTVACPGRIFLSAE